MYYIKSKELECQFCKKLAFLIHKQRTDDGIHPLPVERILDYYELIKDENPKYAGLLCHLLYTWAVYSKDDDMPKWDRPYNEMVYLMKEHLLQREIEANN